MVFWVMDLNPDEAVAAGWLKEKSLTAKVLNTFLRRSLRQADRIIVLDRFMRARILQKGIAEQRVVTIAPWSHNDSVKYDADARRLFREEHGLSDKFVVMYSGNHSPCHPLDTLLQAAGNLANKPEIVFCFVGGGSEQEKVGLFAEQRSLNNIICLPYQPLDKLTGSLSAADLQVVVMGDLFAGIVHPCKIYNILEVGAPFLYIGPSDSHIADLISRLDHKTGICSARHGDVAEVTSYILKRANANQEGRSVTALTSSFSKGALLPQMVKLMESIGAGVTAVKPDLSDASKQPVPQ